MGRVPFKGPEFKDVDEIIGLVDNYFIKCAGKPLTNPDTGDPVFDKQGHPIFIDRQQPTMTGLAMALGFPTRAMLMGYVGRKKYEAAITWAKTRLEEATEQRLFDREGCNGAKFSLQNNFTHWKANPDEDDKKAPVINIVCDIPRAQPDKAAEETQENGETDSE